MKQGLRVLQPGTGDRFYDLKAGIKARLKRAGLTGIRGIPSDTRSPQG